MIQLIIDLVTPLLVNFGASAADVASYLTSLSTYIYVILGSLLAMIVVMVVAHCAKKGNRHVIRWTAAIAWVLVVLLVVNLICYGPMNSIVSGFLNASKAEMSDDVVGNSKEVIAKVGDEGMDSGEEQRPAPPGGGGQQAQCVWLGFRVPRLCRYRLRQCR